MTGVVADKKGGDIGIALENLKTRLELIPQVIEERATEPVVRAVSEIRDQFRAFAGSEGYDFGTLLERGLERSDTVTGIRKSTNQVQGATEVMQKIMEQKLGGEDAPIVHSFFH